MAAVAAVELEEGMAQGHRRREEAALWTGGDRLLLIFADHPLAGEPGAPDRERIRRTGGGKCPREEKAGAGIGGRA